MTKYTESDTVDQYKNFGDVYETVWNEQIHTGYFKNESLSLADAVIEMDRYIAELAGFAKGKHLLNIGSGRGGADRFFAKNFGIDIEGIDISERQIQFARERAAAENLSAQCRYTLASAMSIPFSDGTFDYAFCQESFFYIESKTKAVKEFNRVLKKGGLVVLEDTVVLNKDQKDRMAEVFGNRVKINELLTPEEYIELFQNNEFKLKSRIDVSKHLERTYHEIVNFIQQNKEALKKKIPSVYQEGIGTNFGFDVSEKAVREKALGCVVFVFEK